ncbi:MAG: rhodanese-like domain-containing protein [Flavobacteriales bacterium]|nr:rhodanese-like domain-containing protein [Flavobacteriales bacterium]
MQHILFIALIILSSSCSSQVQNDPSVRRVSQVEWKDLLSQEDDPLIIDVRTPEEFNGGHLDGAVNIDFRSPDFKERMLELDKERTLYLYCHSGGRSAKAMEMLRQEGFESVCELEGGYSQWEP